MCHWVCACMRTDPEVKRTATPVEELTHEELLQHHIICIAEAEFMRNVLKTLYATKGSFEPLRPNLREAAWRLGADSSQQLRELTLSLCDELVKLEPVIGEGLPRLGPVPDSFI